MTDLTLKQLSPRRREVAILVGLDYKREAIAAELGMKLSTVHSTLQQIAARIGGDPQIPAMRRVRGWVNEQQRPRAA